MTQIEQQRGPWLSPLESIEPMNVPFRRIVAATFALVGLGLGLSLAPSVVAQDPDLNQAEEAAIRAAVEKAQDWVVQIETVGGLERVGETLLTNSRTTGTIVDEDGHIVTSLFSLVTQPSSILVTLPGGKRLPAKVVARDRNRMLALLKVESEEPLAEPEIVPREELRVGQWTIALGKIFSAEDANLSVGVLSATDRVWGKAIQTDAKISPNNYGGPLVDIQGRVMGILTPLSPQDTGELAGVEWYDSGIGFAVPISDILPRLDVWKEGTDLRPGLLGVSLKGNDVIVDPPAIGAVRYNSPAQQAGIEAGDVIVKAAGTEIVRQAQLKHILGGLYAEDTVSLTVKRGEEEIDVELTLAGELFPYSRPFLGILPERTGPPPEEFADMADDEEQVADVDVQPKSEDPADEDNPKDTSDDENGDPSDVAGVVVRYVYPDSPAAMAELKAEDTVTHLNDEPITDAASLRIAIQAIEQSESAQKLTVIRAGETLQLEVTLAEHPSQLPEEIPAPQFPEDATKNEGIEIGDIEVRLPEEPNEAFAWIPDLAQTGAPLGLIVWLNTDGESADKLVPQWKEQCEKYGLALLAIQPANDGRWSRSETGVVRKMIDRMAQGYSIEPFRTVIIGAEGGGGLAYLTAFENRDVLGGVVAINAPVPRGASVPDNDPLSFLEIVAMHTPETRLAEPIAAQIAAMEQLKQHVLKVELGLGPEVSSDLEPTNREWLTRWIDTLDRI